ncbi:hypothetical protein T492DRAFT_118941 [Pavlovales sp. CCMP2436]|nr:hypothetical protein T492DRAFT_118941 [Pavlovales sp. CCMP2436]
MCSDPGPRRAVRRLQACRVLPFTKDKNPFGKDQGQSARAVKDRAGRVRVEAAARGWLCSARTGVHARGCAANGIASQLTAASARPHLATRARAQQPSPRGRRWRRRRRQRSWPLGARQRWPTRQAARRRAVRLPWWGLSDGSSISCRTARGSTSTGNNGNNGCR